MTCARGCCPDQKTHYRSISLSSAATPTRRPEAARVNATEDRWNRDMDAYKRLRKDGVQPTQIDGSAAVEREAKSKGEIESGVPDSVVKRIADAQARVTT